MRVPLFKEHPTLRPPPGGALRRVLAILAPVGAGVPSVRALAANLRRHRVELVAASECHGEVRGERGEYLLPQLLLIEAAHDGWDAVVVAGGDGARDVVEDQFAREIVAALARANKPVAALGRGRDVLARAGVDGFATDDPRTLARWLCDRLGVAAPRARVASPYLRAVDADPRPGAR